MLRPETSNEKEVLVEDPVGEPALNPQGHLQMESHLLPPWLCQSQALGLTESCAPLGVRVSGEQREKGGVIGPPCPSLNFRLDQTPKFLK